jgi:hypothetical protein
MEFRTTSSGSTGNSISALHIISSGLYSPLPFANLSQDDVAWMNRRSIALPGCEIQYTPELLVAGPPHFLRVSAMPPAASAGAWTITVEVYAAPAEAVQDAGKPEPIKARSYLL